MPDSHLVNTFGQGHMLLPDDMTKLSKFEESKDSFSRKCKIICTMGPACWDVDTLVKLIDAGMNICRLNFSHGDHEGHGATVKRIREATALRPNKPVAILLDTKGPEIRTGFFREDVGKTISLEKGKELKLVADYNFKGDATCIALSYDKICTSVKPGNIILCADGSLSLKVKSVASDHVITEILNSCNLGERKNCNLPGVKVDLPVLGEKDKTDLVEFGIVHGVDFVAASFVQSADDVKLIRSVLGEEGKNIKIISKIENEEGLKNFEEICAVTDGIMVARGDLGMEIPPEKVFLAQKMMIATCNRLGKPVVTATQMLESMISLPRPTRAEASDVANAVLDGTDCVMLSGETANGAFPVNAVTIMRRVCEEAEIGLDYRRLFLATQARVKASGLVSSPEALCMSAVRSATDMEAKLIVAITETGHTAQLIAKYRPQCQILAFASDPQVVRQLQCVRGVVPVLAEDEGPTDLQVNKALYWAKINGLVKAGDLAVIVHSIQATTKPHLARKDSLLAQPGVGESNMVRVVTVQ
jgi:pyruvate kinase